MTIHTSPTKPDSGLDPPPGSRLPGLVQTFLYGKFRHRLLPIAHRKHGDIFTLKLAQFADTVTVLANPEHFRTVFGGAPTTFHAGYAVLAPAMGEHSVLIANEAEHHRLRRLVMPAFSGAALAGYQDLIAELTRQEIDGWTPGRPMAVYPRMQALTLEIIMQVVFGITDAERLRQMRPLVFRIASIGPMTLLGLTNPTLRRLPPWRQFAERQALLDELLYSEIRQRRTQDCTGRSDVLSRLIQMSSADSETEGLTDAELRDQLVTLLLAGHETTSASLAWALHELTRRPNVLAQTRKAAISGDDEYLGAVSKETLRLYPVVYEVARKLAASVEIAGYRLTSGSAVMPAVGLVHANAKHFPRPQEFDPTRFLTGAPPSTHTWLPFGGGARRCIGAGFAQLEMTVVLRELLRSRTIQPAESRPEPAYVRNVTLVPRRGARIVPGSPTADRG